jgi:hypothetical protein
MSKAAVFHHRQRSFEDVQLLISWYKIRDTFLGLNGTRQDFNKALQLAAVCDDPHAVWLTKLFAGRDGNNIEDAQEVFLGSKSDARAVCFVGVLRLSANDVLHAANLGDAFAQAKMAARTSGDERFEWAEKSASQGERDGFFELGCSQRGTFAEVDSAKVEDCLLIASELGHLEAISFVGWMLDENDPQRFFWFGRAAVCSGDAAPFVREFSAQISDFMSGTGHANVVFAIGRALKGHVDNEERTFFGRKYSPNSFAANVERANHALSFYEFQLQSYRKAVDYWTLVALRNSVVKDIRKMIGKIIWNAREEAKYLMITEINNLC